MKSRDTASIEDDDGNASACCAGQGKSPDRDKGFAMPLMTRRRFAEGVAGVALLVAFGATGRAFAGEASLMRPPGGQSAELLYGACIRCDRCRSACPQGVIDVATIEDGLIEMRTPKMNFHLGYCDECGGEYRCVEACTAGALRPFDKAVDRIGIAVIDFDRCETYGISARCKAECVSACPEQALSLNESGRLVINDALCWGCGACEYVCPSNSYRVYDGSTERGINIQVWGA